MKIVRGKVWVKGVYTYPAEVTVEVEDESLADDLLRAAVAERLASEDLSVDSSGNSKLEYSHTEEPANWRVER